MSDPTFPGARLSDQILVLQAQGVLMERDDYTDRAALAAMHVCAHRLGVDVVTVASAVIHSFSMSRSS